MVEPLSPLGAACRPGSHGNFADGAGVRIAETRPGSIVQFAAWPDTGAELIAAVAPVLGFALPAAPGAGVVAGPRSAFGIGPRRFLAVDQAEGLAARLSPAVPPALGSVTDLSHGRTAIRIEGARAEWVLSKLFAIDFSEAAFPLGAGRSTQHHDVFAQIQRISPDGFDLYVYRSFARSFWTTLCHAADEVGYEVR